MHTLFLILFILMVATLLIYTFIASFSSSKGRQSMETLSQYLQLVNAKFDEQGTIDAEQERKKMEILQNKVKACCDQHAITANTELRLLFTTLGNHLSTYDRPMVPDKSSWIKLKALTSSFYDHYFHCPANGQTM